ncbi:competence type IV pilus minor pilin ComGF [Fructilactobacillus frigidiflavus]|uniref:competence type IV pilus minor pilin ComGF n=1 Tax=Fructilactobacillus frigidiflavus TaxID=3242688 RepID=UPI0037580DDF
MNLSINKLRNGFSLVETIFSLLIISIAVSLIGFTFQQMRQNNLNQQQASEIFRYLDLIESKQFAFKSVMIKNNQLYLYSQTEKKNYIVSRYKDQIKMKTADGGYMPLILHVETASWKIHQDQVISTIKLGDKNYEFTSKLPKER